MQLPPYDLAVPSSRKRNRAMLDYTYENFPTIKRRRDVSTVDGPETDEIIEVEDVFEDGAVPSEQMEREPYFLHPHQALFHPANPSQSRLSFSTNSAEQSPAASVASNKVSYILKSERQQTYVCMYVLPSSHEPLNPETSHCDAAGFQLMSDDEIIAQVRKPNSDDDNSESDEDEVIETSKISNFDAFECFAKGLMW
ncbi:hypothetical protein AVEN_249679-1 [Araneus ventricosus]|uniref:Uncharacterized protein n=1 Tax=Araneus ventricosus TaxID=182803 RepID=A0A4Y2F6L6_ARAVE|nr:hypothetical protein AVEN_249679-1 [Araneus ventricosus]